MNKNYQFTLDKSGKKYHCPCCEKKRLVRYIDQHTRELLPEKYGRCDREINCAYHLNPYTDGYTSNQNHPFNNSSTTIEPMSIKPVAAPTLVHLPPEILSHTLKGYEYNRFIQYLLNKAPFPFEPSEVEALIALYRLGTIHKGAYKGALTIPFIDEHDWVRAIQVKNFDDQNKTTQTTFIHGIFFKELKKEGKDVPSWLLDYHKQDKKVTAFFGAHLLKEFPSNPIALVEAPKTALYASLYFGIPKSEHDLLWLAVYNLSSFNKEKCEVLQGRDVYVFADLSTDGRAFALWSKKVEQLEKVFPDTSFTMYDYLEQHADEVLDKDRENGADLADFLITQDWRLFRKKRREAPLDVLENEGEQKIGESEADEQEAQMQLMEEQMMQERIKEEEELALLMVGYGKLGGLFFTHPENNQNHFLNDLNTCLTEVFKEEVELHRDHIINRSAFLLGKPKDDTFWGMKTFSSGLKYGLLKNTKGLLFQFNPIAA